MDAHDYHYLIFVVVGAEESAPRGGVRIASNRSIADLKDMLKTVCGGALRHVDADALTLYCAGSNRYWPTTAAQVDAFVAGAKLATAKALDPVRTVGECYADGFVVATPSSRSSELAKHASASRPTKPTSPRRCDTSRRALRLTPASTWTLADSSTTSG